MKPRIVFFVLVVVGVIVWDRLPLADAAGRLEALPLAGPGFAGRDLPLNEGERTSFGEADVVKRVYRIGNEGVIVTVVDGTHDRHAIHDPLYCFRGAGWAVAEQERVAVPGGWARRVTLVRDDVSTVAVYWFSDGEQRHASIRRYWRQTIARRVTRGHTGEEPVLVFLQPATKTPHWDVIFRRLPSLFRV